MSDGERPTITPVVSAMASSPSGDRRPAPESTARSSDAMICDRCGAAVYRMHAVWRCPACGFKTDCCGW